MWTRGKLRRGYRASHLAPWNMPGAACPRGTTGTYPGYGPNPLHGGYTELRLDRGPSGNPEIALGFGYAKDPSNPLTWRGQPTTFT
jgi:hypothetical protein